MHCGIPQMLLDQRLDRIPMHVAGGNQGRPIPLPQPQPQPRKPGPGKRNPSRQTGKYGRIAIYLIDTQALPFP